MPTLTYRLGLLGYPLDHSLSPAIHQAALQALGLRGEYRLYPVVPASDSLEKLSQFCDRLRRGELHGLNVTIPYKLAVIPLVDALTPLARAVCAVNTLYVQEDQLIGDNTDVPGFLSDLTSFLGNLPPLPLGEGEGVGVGNSPLPPGEGLGVGVGSSPLPPGKGLGVGIGSSPLPLGEGLGVREMTALVLGAGGAARSVVYALLKTGWRVLVAARRLEQANELVNAFEGLLPKAIPIPIRADAIQDALSQATLIVNTTPVGMHPHTGASPLPPGTVLPSGVCAYDLIYNPPQTEFLRQANQQGGRVSNSLGMLVEQAALSFERWTGVSAPRSLMWQAALRALGGKP